MQLKLTLIAIGAAALLGTTIFLMMHRSKTVAAFPQPVLAAYKDWCREFNKCPPNEDIDIQVARLNIFYDNYKKIEYHNKKQSSYTMAINQFMDMTPEEFAKTHLTLFEKKSQNTKHVHRNTGRIASSVDWRTKGAVTDIKDQGQCGSCWAFSTTGGLEGTYFLKNQQLISFSEQQLVDCSSSEGNMGCNGGLMDYAFQYVITNQGLATEQDYPYTAMDGNCEQQTQVSDIISKFTDVPSGDCDSLISAINQQPISIGVDAETWQFYSGGVFDDCGSSLDHGVLAVGYDTSSNYIVKNSWGESWGEQGYITLAAGNTCGLCNTASYAN